MFQKTLAALAIAALPLAANANLISVDGTITKEGSGTIFTVGFSLDAADTVRLETFANFPQLDPVMWLFHDDGDLDLLDKIAYDNNSGTKQQYSWNALINQSLDAGNYLVFISDMPFPIEAVVRGYNEGVYMHTFSEGDLRLEIESTRALVSLDPLVTGNVPEPASLALLGLGLAGIAARRRRSA